MTNEDIDALWDEVVRNDESHTPRQIHRCFAHAVIERFAAPVADSAMAKDIRREALEEAAQMVERGGHESLELGFERFGRYSKEVAANIRDLAASEPKNTGN